MPSVGEFKITGGEGLSNFVKKAKNINAQLDVGFLTEEVASIAMINEFGATITKTPKMKKFFGMWMKKLGIKLPEGYVSSPVVVIPARPFMQQTFDANSSKWTETLRKLLLQDASKPELTNAYVEEKLSILGEIIVGQIQTQIADGKFVDNAPFTIAMKGKNTPLKDTNKMSKAVNYRVQTK